jgi:outer membrane protein TolC
VSDSTRVRRPRRPTLRQALKAAEKAGKTVKSSKQDPDGTITLIFSNGETTTITDDWDTHLREQGHGKS